MDDIGMMRNPSQWPNWPLLPVKQTKYDVAKGPRPVGVMLAEDGLPLVYHANLFDIAGGKVNIGECPITKYETYEAMIEDGWVVD